MDTKIERMTDCKRASPETLSATSVLSTQSVHESLPPAVPSPPLAATQDLLPMDGDLSPLLDRTALQSRSWFFDPCNTLLLPPPFSGRFDVPPQALHPLCLASSSLDLCNPSLPPSVKSTPGTTYIGQATCLSPWSAEPAAIDLLLPPRSTPGQSSGPSQIVEAPMADSIYAPLSISAPSTLDTYLSSPIGPSTILLPLSTPSSPVSPGQRQRGDVCAAGRHDRQQRRVPHRPALERSRAKTRVGAAAKFCCAGQRAVCGGARGVRPVRGC